MHRPGVQGPIRVEAVEQHSIASAWGVFEATGRGARRRQLVHWFGIACDVMIGFAARAVVSYRNELVCVKICVSSQLARQ